MIKAGFVEGRLWRLLIGAEVDEDKAESTEESDVADTDGRCIEPVFRLLVWSPLTLVIASRL